MLNLLPFVQRVFVDAIPWSVALFMVLGILSCIMFRMQHSNVKRRLVQRIVSTSRSVDLQAECNELVNNQKQKVEKHRIGMWSDATLVGNSKHAQLCSCPLLFGPNREQAVRVLEKYEHKNREVWVEVTPLEPA